jgi:hypothetical protein
MFKALSAFILRSQMHAAGIVGLFGSLAWIFPLLSYLSCAALALIVLSKGVQSAIQVLAGATLFSGIVAFVTMGTPVVTFAMVLVLWLPTILVAEVLRRTRSQTVLILLASLLAVVLAICLRAYIGDVDAFWSNLIERIMQRSNASEALANPAFRETLAAAMNGIVASGFALTMILSVMLGRWWQSLTVNPGGFASEFRQISFPKGLSIAALIMTAYLAIGQVAVTDAGIVLDLSMICVMAFMFGGLAFIHQTMYAKSVSSAWLFGLYLLLFIASIYAAMALAMLGMVASLTGRKVLDKD